MDANSTVNMEGGAFSVGAKNFGIYATGPQLGTVNITADQATHITGIMQVDANLNVNGRGGGILEVDGGRLILAGQSAGGTIAITSGTLEFAQTPGFLQSPETASESFNTKVAFTGQSASHQEFSLFIGNLLRCDDDFQSNLACCLSRHTGAGNYPWRFSCLILHR